MQPLLLFRLTLLVNIFGATLGRPAREFQSVISNCSNDVPAIPPEEYFPSYGPSIYGRQGWETWTVPLPHITNNSLTVFTWTRGDPASPRSNPNGLATFSAYSAYANLSVSVTGKFVYRQVSSREMHISIGENHLVFDGNHGSMVGMWNVSVNIEGLKSVFSIDVVHPAVPLEPAYGGVRSQIIDGYYGSILATRGHAYGLQTYPSGETWFVAEVASVKHTYAFEPMQDLVSSYARGTVFIDGTSLNWFDVRNAKKTKSVDASQLVIGLNVSDLMSFNIKYEATNDRSVYNLSTSGLNTSVVFPGCAASQHNPYSITAFPVAFRGGFVDSAGRTTVYYSVNASSSIWVDKLVVGDGTDSLGILEVYANSD